MRRDEELGKVGVSETVTEEPLTLETHLLAFAQP